MPETEGFDLDTLLAVLDALPASAFVIDGDSVHCNRAMEQLTGYRRGELACVAGFFDTLFGEWSERARYIFDADRDAGFGDPREFSIVCKDGTHRVIKISVSGTGRLLCTVQDVTEQKLTQRALRESEERYHCLSDLTSDYVYCCTRTKYKPFRVSWLGGAIEKITGYSEQEIYDKGCWIGLVHPEDRDRVSYGKMRLTPGDSRTDEFRIICKNGKVCWIKDFSRCEAGDAEGELLLVGASKNITASKAAEIALKNKEEIFRLFLEYSPAYLMFKDENHRIVRLSRNFETLLGKPLQEVMGKTPAEIFPPGDAERIVRDDLRVLEDGRPIQVEEKLQERHYSSLKFSIPQKGKAPLLVTMKTDITEHKKVQDALSRLNEMLDRRVAERTAELEAAIREQESFSYSVSHDLRAPLRHINSFSAIVLEDYSEYLPPQAREYLGRICYGTKRLGVLIDNLLKLSQVSRTAIKRVPVDLSALAANIVLMFKEMEPDRSVSLRIVPGLFANCDQILVRQLFQNLIGNAWKYTAKVPVARIEFGMIHLPQGDVFFVKDNGAGFNMSYQDKLFVPFQRLHGSEFEGNGIGLATAQRIVQRHGGSIWAEGTEGDGATFFFTLPDKPIAFRGS